MTNYLANLSRICAPARASVHYEDARAQHTLKHTQTPYTRTLAYAYTHTKARIFTHTYKKTRTEEEKQEV